MNRITPELLLHAYAQGYFPMAEAADAEDLFWVDPKERGILPLDQFHLPRKLAKLVRQDRFHVTVDTVFDQVMDHCAGTSPGRENTWINAEILKLYSDLHHMGFAHSVECWHDDRLVGGLYGVALGAAFFGESMFHTEPNASKVALVHLVARLRFGGYILLDTQFVTDHLRQFGAIEIPRNEYRELLQDAISAEGDFFALSQSLLSFPSPGVGSSEFGTGESGVGERVLHLSTQTS